MQGLLEDGSYLRPGAYYRKYGKKKQKGYLLRTPLLMPQILVNLAISALFMFSWYGKYFTVIVINYSFLILAIIYTYIYLAYEKIKI